MPNLKKLNSDIRKANARKTVEKKTKVEAPQPAITVDNIRSIAKEVGDALVKAMAASHPEEEGSMEQPAKYRVEIARNSRGDMVSADITPIFEKK